MAVPARRRTARRRTVHGPGGPRGGPHGAPDIKNPFFIDFFIDFYRDFIGILYKML